MINKTKKEKDDIRAAYSQKRKAIPDNIKRELDSAVCRAAVNMASFRYADIVLLYAATHDEINIDEIANEALKRGKKIAYPRCNKETHTMTYHYVSSLSELSPDSYGINEPPKDAPVYTPESDTATALCFVPGLVYDKAGYRIGYGKGFYDRYLSSFSGCSIGVVYSDSILPAVPRGRYDVSVDILLTEKGVKLTSEN